MIHKGKKVLDGTLSSIQDEYGTDTIRVQTSGGAAVLSNLSGVDRIADLGQIQELHMRPGCDAQELLAEIISRTSVRSFDIMKPSLHDIFLRIAGQGAEVADDAQSAQIS